MDVADDRQETAHEIIRRLAQDEVNAKREGRDEWRIFPEVQVNNRQLRDSAGEALYALAEQNVPPLLFVRNGRLVRIGRDEYAQSFIEPLEESALCGLLTYAANFIRRSYLPKTQEFIQTAVSPPANIVKHILSLGSWPASFPSLLGVIISPSLRPDGSILCQPGYDLATRLYYAPTPGFSLPAMPDLPNEEESRAACAFLTAELFTDFPFCEGADLANMLACLLTPIVRPAIAGNVPLCLLDKPTPGSGATLLADVVASVATGQPGAKSLIPEGRGAEEEWRKKITSILIDGLSVTIWDNVDESISSSALAMVLTTPLWRDRVLGKNEMITLPVRTCWIATANNIRLRGDLARRAYHVRIDPNMERPWTREGFQQPELLTWVGKNRAALLAALLTVARAWFVAGQPAPKTVPKMGSFEDWTRILGGILSYAGMPGFLGNLEELAELIDDDGPQWAAFLAAWFDAFGESTRTMSEFVTTAPAGLFDAIPDSVDFDLDKLRSSKIKLGRAFQKRAGRIHGEYKLTRGGQTGHKGTGVRWSVITQIRAN